jgi:hypothetical protein
MNLVLVRRSVELAYRSRRRVQSLIWWSEHPVPGRPETVRESKRICGLQIRNLWLGNIRTRI